MKLNLSIVLSLLIHLAFIYWFVLKKKSMPQLLFKKGKNSTTIISFSLDRTKSPEKNQIKNLDTKQEIKKPQSNGREGNPTEEISKFKNSLSYPEGALEQGLESDCKWEIQIETRGKAKVVRTLKPCLYSIFENHFRKSIQNWKFNLPEGTTLKIPVSFILEK